MVLKHLTRLLKILILSLVIKFQILVRTGTAGGPEGPPLILRLFLYGKALPDICPADPEAD